MKAVMFSLFDSINGGTQERVAPTVMIHLNSDRVKFRIEKAANAGLPVCEEFSFVVKCIHIDSKLELYFWQQRRHLFEEWG